MEKEVLEKLRAMDEQAKKLPPRPRTDADYMQEPHPLSALSPENLEIFKILLYRLHGKPYPPLPKERDKENK
jgi:hypothetical protein